MNPMLNDLRTIATADLGDLAKALRSMTNDSETHWGDWLLEDISVLAETIVFELDWIKSIR